MTIRKGEPWGEAVPVPDGIVPVGSDRAVSRAVELQGGPGIEPIGVAGGDMARTMGGGSPQRFRPGPETTVVRATVDLLRVDTDGASFLALAHVVARRSWWRGEVVLAMNAQFFGSYDVAPRSHPNDGRVDVVSVDPAMGMRARRQARRRARTGTHLPHPQLTLTSTAECRLEFTTPLHLWIDGERVATVSTLHITVVPDALTLLA